VRRSQEILETLEKKKQEEKDKSSRQQRSLSILSFRVGRGLYAFPLEQIQFTCWEAPITPVPGAPHPFQGVVHLQGKIIPVLDMVHLLGSEKGSHPEAGSQKTTWSNGPSPPAGQALAGEVDRHERGVMIVISHENTLLCAPVDQLEEILEIKASEVRSELVPESLSRVRFIKGGIKKGDQIICLLDATHLAQWEKSKP